MKAIHRIAGQKLEPTHTWTLYLDETGIVHLVCNGNFVAYVDQELLLTVLPSRSEDGVGHTVALKENI